MNASCDMAGQTCCRSVSVQFPGCEQAFGLGLNVKRTNVDNVISSLNFLAALRNRARLHTRVSVNSQINRNVSTKMAKSVRHLHWYKVNSRICPRYVLLSQYFLLLELCWYSEHVRHNPVTACASSVCLSVMACDRQSKRRTDTVSMKIKKKHTNRRKTVTVIISQVLTLSLCTELELKSTYPASNS